jgi:hypothetical protein
MDHVVRRNTVVYGIVNGRKRPYTESVTIDLGRIASEPDEQLIDQSKRGPLEDLEEIIKKDKPRVIDKNDPDLHKVIDFLKDDH